MVRTRATMAALACLLTLCVSPVFAGADPLKRLRDDIDQYLEGGGASRTALESRELAARLGFAAALAEHTPPGEERNSLLHEVETLRARFDATLSSAAGPTGMESSRAAAIEPAGAADGLSTGILEGRVTSLQSGQPALSIEIDLYGEDGFFFNYAYTDDDGRYHFEGLAPGTYFLRAATYYSQQLAPQLWQGIPCPNLICNVTQGTPIVIQSSQTFVADFQLQSHGIVQGRVTAAESGQELAGLQVHLYDRYTYYLSSLTLTEADGSYTLYAPTEGAFYVVVPDSLRPGLLYDGIPCAEPSFSYYLQCDASQGEPIEMLDGSVRTGVDFALIRGGSISGKVTDARTQGAIADTPVSLYDTNFNYYTSTTTHTDGTYRFDGLLGSRYFLVASGSNEYSPQSFRLHNCLSELDCKSSGADPVDLVLGEDRQGVDFVLIRRGTVTGHLIDEVSRQPIFGGSISAYTPGGEGLGGTSSDSTGFFSFSNAPVGEIILRAEANGYAAELYDNVPAQAGLARATKVAVRSGEVVVGIDFALARLARIRGKVVDAATNAGIPSCGVYARSIAEPWPGPGSYSSYCDIEGNFEILGLPAGTYNIFATAFYGSYTTSVLGVGSCNWNNSGGLLCDLSRATAIPVEPSQVSGPYEIRLEAASQIRGSVSFEDSYPGILKQVQVGIYDEFGQQVALDYLDAENGPNTFGFYNLARGSYYLKLDGLATWQDALYQDDRCTRWYCDPLHGEKIDLGAGVSSGGYSIATSPLRPYEGCENSATSICLEKGRYQVEATWRDFLGQEGPAYASRLTDQTAYFWFFSPGNVELVVKALNACSRELGHHFWLFSAGLTNVDVRLTVTDTLTGERKVYDNPLGALYRPVLDTSAFATCDAMEPAATSVPSTSPASALISATSFPPLTRASTASNPEVAASSPLAYCPPDPWGWAVCLHENRFRISARFKGPNDTELHSAYPIYLTDDTLAFYFFSSDNAELLIKVLDACAMETPGYWVFAAGLTDVVVELTVEDLMTGVGKTYSSGPGSFQTLSDLGSFSASCAN